MSKDWSFSEILSDIQHAPVFILLVVDFIFLGVLIYVFKSDTAAELRTVLKDAFIGWNGALAIAINVQKKDPATLTLDQENTQDGTSTSTSVVNKN